MKTITKKQCVAEVGGSFLSTLIIATVMAVVFPFLFWLENRDLVWTIILAVLLIAILLFGAFTLRKRLKSIQKHNYYIVEDVFINVQEKYALANRIRRIRRGGQYYYEIDFCHNGVHCITLFDKKEPEELDADYSAVHFSKSGDKFYLLVLQGEKESAVLKCFNARYYELFEDDFDYIDGKYYPKNLNRPIFSC